MVLVSHLVHYDSLLQNMTDIITKYDSCFFTKCDKSLFENASAFSIRNAAVLLQNATVTTKYHNEPNMKPKPLLILKVRTMFLGRLLQYYYIAV